MDENAIVQPILVPNYMSLTEAWAAYLAARVCVVAYYERQEKDLSMWEQWLDGPFTKTIRKYSTKDRDVFRNIEGATGRSASSMKAYPFFAFPPVSYANMDKRIRTCQVQGINYSNTASYPTSMQHVLHKEDEKYLFAFHVNPYLSMSSGKIMAQVCHAALSMAILMPDENITNRFLITKHTEIFDKVDSDIYIKDAGYTEVPAGSLTVKTEILQHSLNIL